ncbi:sodium:solute symporter family protein [Desulfocurvibacter africanus]|uniref:Putative sodium symporter protein n=1 Tax=Desulfocurvibacter africanus subsp. africanus str. Walvis Bay TaxID=690850 RepID=F3Z3K6_DESAF|nr:sodium:solute symporter family protein [Desulfocurvibacter africanus]EGJ50378.1 putative sodium symporter protein [Desulfocurvibacter africanus subsp. africanus str. Walvis Bay]
MSILVWTYIIVGATFALYMSIAWMSRVKDTKGFYVAGGGVPPLANGMATAADWMSAASFISMAGIISFAGYGGAVYLMGWTGGFVLLALCLAPYLRKFGKFTVPDFVGDRYYSNTARIVALVCAIFASLTYVAGQMRGVGIVFSRFLEVDVNTGVIIGMAIVFFYAGLGGMKGITWTQVAQYCVLILAFLIPAVAISMKITGNPIPQLGFGSAITEGPHAGRFLLETLDHLHRDLGFSEYTSAFGAGNKSMLDVLAITMALMVGTAGLPHVIVRFYTVPTVRGARWSAGWALLFIAILYTAAPAVSVFARYNMIESISGVAYEQAPSWFKNWEKTGLLAWVDKTGDGIIQYRAGEAFKGKPEFIGEVGDWGQRMVKNPPTDTPNELYVDADIMVLANPEIANLPAWVVALIAAGALAAALSTASGLLLVIASSISHDLYYRVINRKATERQRLRLGRIMIGIAVVIAGYFGINPPGFVAQVVALAFGLAASSFFPILILGIFSKRVNREGAIAGMLSGIGFTIFYIVQTKFLGVAPWFMGISPEGIGAVGMCINFAVTFAVSHVTPPPPQEIRDLVESVRTPRGAGAAVDH